MTDVHSPEQRRYNMSRIRGKDTKPEMCVRRGLYRLGLRYRVNVRDLPGKPDLAFKLRRVAVFVHGCFWHGHQRCQYFKLPKSRTEFWKTKINSTISRDQLAIQALMSDGWRVLVIWECALKGRELTDQSIKRSYDFITNEQLQFLELSAEGKRDQL